jgi:hypothetical protein
LSLPAIRKTITPLYAGRVPRDAFPGYDEPVNIEGEPEEVLKLLLADEIAPGADDVVEPVLDD